jgi:hypothetical protein
VIQKEGDDKAISVKDAPLFKAGWYGWGLNMISLNKEERIRSKCKNKRR